MNDRLSFRELAVDLDRAQLEFEWRERMRENSQRQLTEWEQRLGVAQGILRDREQRLAGALAVGDGEAAPDGTSAELTGEQETPQQEFARAVAAQAAEQWEQEVEAARTNVRTWELEVAANGAVLREREGELVYARRVLEALRREVNARVNFR